MDREQIYTDMKKTIGLVPSMFKSFPDDILELEWNLFKKTELSEGPIPGKYRELIGLAISAAQKCQYCTFFHVENARLFGATEEEIENALSYAKMTTGWSTYLNGMQLNTEQFKSEVKEIGRYLKEHKGK